MKNFESIFLKNFGEIISLNDENLTIAFFDFLISFYSNKFFSTYFVKLIIFPKESTKFRQFEFWNTVFQNGIKNSD